MPQISNQIKMGSGENYKYIIDGNNAAVGDIEKYLKISEIKKIIGRKTIYRKLSKRFSSNVIFFIE